MTIAYIITDNQYGPRAINLIRLRNHLAQQGTSFGILSLRNLILMSTPARIAYVTAG